MLYWTFLQDFALSNKTVNTVLVKLLHILYDADVLSENVLIKWHRMDKEDEYKAIKKQVQWLYSFTAYAGCWSNYILYIYYDIKGLL